MTPGTARQLVEELRHEKAFLNEVIDLIERGMLSIDDSGEEPRFGLTLKGAAALRGGVQ